MHKVTEIISHRVEIETLFDSEAKYSTNMESGLNGDMTTTNALLYLPQL